MVYKEVVSANAKRRTTWFDLLLKSKINQNKNHILGPSIMAIAKKLKELIQKDDLTIADLEVVFTESEWNVGEGDVSKPRSFEIHMSKSIKPHPSFYNNDFYHLTDGVKRRSNNKEYTFSYADLSRLSLNDIKDRYENLIDMVNKNELDQGNKRLKGRDWNDKDVKRSTQMMDKIDQVMKRMEQLRRFKEYIGRRPKTIDPHSYVRPL
ncbi:hypothetical protein Tco_1117846 [Tanacetum coccineum]